MKAWLCFILGFILVFGPAFAYCGNVSEIWQEKTTKINFAYVEDGTLKPFPGFETALMGYMPRNVVIQKINCTTDSEIFKAILGAIYEM